MNSFVKSFTKSVIVSLGFSCGENVSLGRVAYLVRPPAAGVELGETNFDGFSSHR